MTKFIISLVLNGVAVLGASYLLSGVHVNGIMWAIVVGAVLGVINSVITPIVKTVALPVTVLTFGLFSLVINGLMVLLADYLLTGFWVDNILWAIAFSFILSLINSVLGVAK